MGSYQSRHSGAKIDSAVDQLATLTATAAASATSAANSAGSAATATTKAAEAAASAANAVAVVTGGTATLTPEAGKIPLAGADAQFAHGWVAPPALPLSRPSLLLDFKKGHIDPRITFTRASAATYFDNQGVLRTALSGEPRIDHDPVTGACLGLLIEEQRTNVMLNSIVNSQCTLSSGSIVGPQGVLASLATVKAQAISFPIIGSSATNSFTANNGESIDIAFSGFFAAGPGPLVLEPRFVATISTDGSSNFSYAELQINTATGTVRTISLGTCTEVSAPSIVLRNGMYFVTWVIRYTQGATVRNRWTTSVQIRPTDGNGVFTGDGTSGVQYNCTQAELGSFPTSYIPTTTAAATRAADVASMTGVNFSSWYRQDEGTLIAEWRNGADIDSCRVVMIDDGSSANQISVISAATNGTTGQYGYVGVGGVAQVNIATGTPAVRYAENCLSFAYKANNFAASRNGVAVSTDSDGAIPTVNRMVLGGTNVLNGHIKRFVYYPKLHANAALQALSTP